MSITAGDGPIHLAEFSICKKQPHSESSVTVPVWITQSSLDGLQALIRFTYGLRASGKGSIPGEFELIMFYRQLASAIRSADNKANGIGEESA